MKTHVTKQQAAGAANTAFNLASAASELLEWIGLPFNGSRASEALERVYDSMSAMRVVKSYFNPRSATAFDSVVIHNQLRKQKKTRKAA